MATISSFLHILSLLLLFFHHISSSSSSPTTINIPLSFFNNTSYQDPYQKLFHLASVSISRAHQIKYQEKAPITTTPLFPRSYGAYSISLDFGTPPQSTPFIFDTGSNFVWFPCTLTYECSNCSVDDQPIAAFFPKQSSSVKILGCMNPKCTWLHTETDPSSRCQDCKPPNTANCTQICPPYLIVYGSGSTEGFTLFETLDLVGRKVPNFIVGCSLFSSHLPSGIAGFGRGLTSMPSQLGLKRFSYCLLSHKFDDADKSNMLVLDSNDSYEKAGNFSYTPFLKNPMVPGKSSLAVYYYVSLRKITVGGKKVKIPYEYLTSDKNGNGGAIVDSGTTFTYMSRDVFEPILKAFVEQVKEYKRDEDIEIQSGLSPCFNISGHEKLSFPQLKFHFKGGAEMVLPLANYFFIVGGEFVCLTMVTSDFYGPEMSSGPSIILGNFQMQNYHVEFDLKNQRFGFQQQLCM